MNKKYESIEEIINKPHIPKEKTKSKLHQDFSNFEDEMSYTRQKEKFQCEEELFSKDAQGIAMIVHGALLIVKFVQTEPQFLT